MRKLCARLLDATGFVVPLSLYSLLCAFPDSLYAQESIYQSIQNTTLIQPSPTAASFQKYGITPVSLQNGLPNIDIPIYSIECGDLDVPISLSYHNNGLKTQEEASWVGLGWNLNAGGVITRILNGSVDGSLSSGFNFGQFSAIDSIDFYNNGYGNRRLFTYGVYFNQTYDIEPDIFVYNFPGHQGKFVSVNNNVYTADYERLQITDLGYNNGFSIRDDKGTVYTFTTIETTRTLKGGNQQMQNGYPSAYYLTSIFSADGHDQIHFYYNAYTYRAGDYITGQVYNESFGESQTSGCGASGQGVANSSLTTTQSYGNVIAGYSLSSIATSDGQTISFIPQSSGRQDVNSNEYALAQVVVHGKTGFTQDSVIKRFVFNYGYFMNGGSATATYSRLKLAQLYEMNGAYDTLNSYAFQYNAESANFPDKGTVSQDWWGYYNDTRDLTVFGGAGLIPQIPFQTYSVGIATSANTPFSTSRAPNAAASIYGVLDKIIYPTGGYTTFDYEQNAYYSSDSIQVPSPPGTGITIVYANDPPSHQASGNFTITDQQFVKINYSRDIPSGQTLPYKNFTPIVTISQCTNCVADWVDSAGFVPNTVVMWTSPALYTTNSELDSVLLSPGIYIYTVTCESRSVDVSAYLSFYTMSPNYDGSPAPGLRIKTVTDYDGLSTNAVAQRQYSYRSPNGYTSGVLVADPSIPIVGTMALGTGSCSNALKLTYSFNSDNNGAYNANLHKVQYYSYVREMVVDPANPSNNYYTDHSYAMVDPTDPAFSTNNYNLPYPYQGSTVENLVLSNPVETGTLVWKTVADNHILVKSTQDNYQYVVDTVITGFKPIQLRTDITSQVGDPTTTEWAFNEYNLQCVWKYPISRTETEYDDAGNSVVKSTTYGYDMGKKHLMIDWENIGNGKTVVDKYKYPDDYANSVTDMAVLAGAYVTSPKAEIQVWVKTGSDSNLLRGVVTDYSSSWLKPTRKYILNTAQPLTGPDGETVSGGQYTSLLDDSHYYERLRDSYNGSGKLIEETDDNNHGLTTTYVWGYGDILPVAKIVGAHFSDVLTVIDTGAIQSIQDDATLRSVLAPLRTLPHAEVEIYTYRPFVGMTSKTDMAGRTTYYDYDKFNRLADIKDLNGNIIKTFTYHYKGIVQ